MVNTSETKKIHNKYNPYKIALLFTLNWRRQFVKKMIMYQELRAKSHDHELLKRDHAESRRAVELLQVLLEGGCG